MSFQNCITFFSQWNVREKRRYFRKCLTNVFIQTMEVNGQQNWLPASWTYDKLIVWYDGTFIFGYWKPLLLVKPLIEFIIYDDASSSEESVVLSHQNPLTVLDCFSLLSALDLCIFLSWFRLDDLSTEESNIVHGGHFWSKKNVLTREYLVDYCDVFISCLDFHSDGTHSLQRIHWWESDVMLTFSKSVLMEK